jgi:hypothetical protein
VQVGVPPEPALTIVIIQRGGGVYTSRPGVYDDIVHDRSADAVHNRSSSERHGVSCGRLGATWRGAKSPDRDDVVLGGGVHRASVVAGQRVGSIPGVAPLLPLWRQLVQGYAAAGELAKRRRATLPRPGAATCGAFG